MCIFCFEMIKLLLSYFLIKVIFDVIEITSDFFRLFVFVKSRRRRMCFVYPHARYINQVSETCTVCLSSGTNAVLECGHAYHWDCVRQWLDQKGTCPVCR